MSLKENFHRSVLIQGGNIRFLDGDILPVDSLSSPLLFGNGVFATLALLDGRPIFWRLHLQRLNSLKRGNLWLSALNQLWEKSGKISFGRVRISIFGDFVLLSLQKEKFTNFLKKIREIGIFPDLYSPASNNRKTMSYQKFIEIKKYAVENLYDECVFFNDNRELVESSMANVFMVKNGKIYTPSLQSGCVNGVVREVLLQYDVIEKSIPKEDFLENEGVFFTNSLRGLIFSENVDYLIQESLHRYFLAQVSAEITG